MDQVNSFQGRRIVLGVCGGIAAYKAIELCRQLVDAGAFVSVVMTESSKEFVGEATFSALSSEAVWSSLFAEQDPIPHTRLGQAADLIVVAPATARLISAYATGYSHDLLTNVLLATRAPVVICPAMHTEMWEHPAVQDNLKILSQRGVHVVDPEEGRLAGGDIGSGRLAGTERVLEALRGVLSSSTPSGVVRGDENLASSPSGLHGLNVLVTAGGTREPIDPVRYIGNRSSGKQGHALAEEALARGAVVTLVTTTQIATSPAITCVSVDTAQEMHDAVMSRSATADVIVMAAAVADFAPSQIAPEKLKKSDGAPMLEMHPTIDILAALGSCKPKGQTLVGFAAETQDVRVNAERKLKDKQADILVVNDVAAPGVGFEFETNEVAILCAASEDRFVPLTDKRSVAAVVLDVVVSTRSAQESVPSSGE